MEQLGHGVEPSKVTFEKQLGIVQDHSIRWLVNGYEAINNPELVQKVISMDILSFSYLSDIFTGFSTMFYWTEELQSLI